MDPVSALVDLGGFAPRGVLVRLGVTRYAIESAQREGRIVRIHRGIYGLGLPEGTDALRAAVTKLGATVSHDSAAVLWGLEMVRRPRPVVTVPRNRAGRTSLGVAVMRADIDDGDLDVRDGVRVTSVLRTILDCARELPLADAVVLADSALRKRLITIEELRSAAGQARGRGAAPVRRVARLADRKSASVLESLLRVLLVENNLAPDVTQYAVRDEVGNLIAWVDFGYLAARLLVEADGFAFHSERDDYRKDRRRANTYCRLNWRLLRFSWEDVRFDPDYVVDAIRVELAKPVPDPSRRPKRTQRPR